MICIGYVIRRLRDGGTPCRARLCAGRTAEMTGIVPSVWCGHHTEQILTPEAP